MLLFFAINDVLSYQFEFRFTFILYFNILQCKYRNIFYISAKDYVIKFDIFHYF